MLTNDAKRLGGSPIEFAKALGTYGKIDRKRQYEGEFDGLDGVELRRKLQNKYDQLFANQRRLEQQRFHHRLMQIAAAAALARLPEIYEFISKFFQ